jgi:hypothetical protein
MDGHSTKSFEIRNNEDLVMKNEVSVVFIFDL